jgi:hypothetical protein
MIRAGEPPLWLLDPRKSIKRKPRLSESGGAFLVNGLSIVVKLRCYIYVSNVIQMKHI